MELHGKTFIVTGASRGIGRGLAEMLAKCGSRLAISGRNKKNLLAAEEAIRELQRLQNTGASLIIFVWSSFWWLDHYSEFHAHLTAHCPLLHRSENIVAYDLRSPVVKSSLSAQSSSGRLKGL